MNYFLPILLLFIAIPYISSTSLHTIYVETTTEDNVSSYWDKLADFVITSKVFHVAIGILDMGSSSNNMICGVSQNSYIVNNFFKKLSGTNTRISVHPYDGFGNPAWPLNYGNYKGLEAVMHYIVDMNSLLQKLKITVTITGIVVGESMGSKPFRGDAATVTLFRSEAAKVGLKNLLIGSAAGDLIGMGLDEKYEQIYDWTFYDGVTNKNIWETYNSNPAGFFKFLDDPNVKSGWNTDAVLPKAPWSEFKNYVKNIQGKMLWKWQITPDNQRMKDGNIFMVAWQVPNKNGGNQNRMSGWGLKGLMNFFDYVNNAMTSQYHFALYFDSGLKPFH